MNTDLYFKTIANVPTVEQTWWRQGLKSKIPNEDGPSAAEMGRVWAFPDLSVSLINEYILFRTAISWCGVCAGRSELHEVKTSALKTFAILPAASVICGHWVEHYDLAPSVKKKS